MIESMSKLTLIGLCEQKDDILKFLQKNGSVQVSDTLSLSQDENFSDVFIQNDNTDEKNKTLQQLADVRTALSLLDTFAPCKTGFFPQKNEMCDFTGAYEAVTEILTLYDEQNSLKSRLSSLDNKILSLTPWLSYDLPLNHKGTKYTKTVTGVLLSMSSPDKFTNDIQKLGGIAKLISSDSMQSYIAVTYHRAWEQDFSALFTKYGFSESIFSSDTTAYEATEICKREIQSINQRQTEIQNEIIKLAARRTKIRAFYDYLSVCADRYAVKEKLAQTNSTFYLTGWTLSDSAEMLKSELLKKFVCDVTVEIAADDEAYPILLRNNKAVTPFEVVTEQYSLPKPHGFDPNAVMAPFYFIFFGMMLSDAGYGILLSLACAFVIFKYKPEGTARKMFGLLLLGGISTIFWGAMFGSWFGDLLPLPPLMYNPVEKPMDLLILSFILGGVHLLTGMGVKGYILIKEGKPWDAVFDIGSWYFILIGIGLLFMGGKIGEVGKYLAIFGVLLLIVTGGRHETNIFKKIFGGFMGLYDITGYLSDVLSYSRLLALGLATGVIAQVINQMGKMGGPVVFAVACLIGHPFNLAINALGAYVHACRLQYVEFFGKFYEGGGKPFKPLCIKTKYTKMKEEI